ncbi:MAG: YggS family pyridoxal phosphate-dependent enzyme [Clostridia bacterium]|nr:YggS family pyridoxal phosphate-dependent enzyme [Clostridia bacterium]
MSSYIKDNLTAVQADLHAAEAAAGREGKTTLIAAVKYASDCEIKELISLGVSDVGENRVQQLLAHMGAYEGKDLRIHFIGTLQKNKIKYIIDKVHAIHSVDSAQLAREIDRHAAKHSICMRVFVEINIGREEAKSGVMPEEAEALCREIEELPNLSLVGLMTMAPRCESDAEYRGYFSEARKLARSIWQDLGRTDQPLLSMGMSESFAAAVAEGTDMVRVGRRLFVHENHEI